MLMTIAISVACIWALFKFGGRIANLVNGTFDIAESGMNVGKKHVEEWEKDVDMRLQTKSQLNEEARNEQLAALNALREKSNKKPLEL